VIGEERAAARVRWRPNVGTVGSIITLCAVIGLFIVGR
jgi:hypothetical protein